jgi:hypothetical protein
MFLGSPPRTLHRDNHALDSVAESRSEAQAVSNSGTNQRRVDWTLSLFPDDPEQVGVEPVGTPVTLLNSNFGGCVSKALRNLSISALKIPETRFCSSYLIKELQSFG